MKKHAASRQKKLDQIIAMTEKLVPKDGRIQTAIPFLILTRTSHPTTFCPGVLTPSFCLVAQGAKKVLIGRDIIHYQAGEFIASVMDMPATGSIVKASKASPYLGLRVDFMSREIASVMSEAKIRIKAPGKKLNAGAFVGQLDNELLELFEKMLKLLLDRPEEAAFMSGLLKREMIFRLLTGDYGHLFFRPMLFDQKTGGIGKVIEWIKSNYSKAFTVEQLAKSNGMSTSGLHHKFKAITTMGPLQYQKQLRLQEARRLMMSGAVDATTAALEVGYESPSQFNREYRRLYGLPPLKDMKAMKKSAIAFSGDHDG